MNIKLKTETSTLKKGGGVEGFFMLWLPRFYTKAIMQPSRKHIKNQNKINSYKFLKPFLVPREDVGGHKQKGERE